MHSNFTVVEGCTHNEVLHDSELLQEEEPQGAEITTWL